MQSSRRSLPIEPLAVHDFEACQQLVVESAWNQLPDDWQLFTDFGSGFKIRDDDGNLVATAATLPFAPDFGWISMVLVRQSHRRQGLATALIDHCVAHLRQQQLVPMLDATPAGRMVYAQRGFSDGWSITRWRRGGSAPVERISASLVGAGNLGRGTAVRPLSDADWQWLLSLDQQAFGADRAPLLQRLAQRSLAFACVAEREGHPTGYLLGRTGRTATQIGPVVATDPHGAAAMVQHALARLRGPVLIDVLDHHADLAAAVRDAGFAVERSYTRMALSQPQGFGDAQHMMAIAGPELA